MKFKSTNGQNLICDLRRKCSECGEEFGRRVITSQSGYSSLESIGAFNARGVCSIECGGKRRSRRQQEAKAEREAMANQAKSAIDWFIYGRAG